MSNIGSANGKANRRLVSNCHDLVFYTFGYKNKVPFFDIKCFAVYKPFPLSFEDIPPLVPIWVVMQSIALARQLGNNRCAVALRIHYTVAPRHCRIFYLKQI